MAQFNGASSYVSVSNVSEIGQISNGGGNKVTITGWAFESAPLSGTQLNIVHLGGSAECTTTDNNLEIFLNINNAYTILQCNNDEMQSSTVSVPSMQWVFYASTFNGSTFKGHLGLGGQFYSGATITGITNVILPNGPVFSIGGSGPFTSFWNGQIANVQIYNTTLSANDIQALYQEGIGGAPVDLQNLVGWWPLNGNAHDYSGNNNNGQINGGVTFTSSWENGYTPP